MNEVANTVAGALMPDAHQGYGLPIGGVLATENAVIPYGVGVDIGCRMCLTIFDLPSTLTEENHDRLKNVLQRETLFGAGAEFKKPMDDEVLERKEFREIRNCISYSLCLRYCLISFHLEFYDPGNKP